MSNINQGEYYKIEKETATIASSASLSDAVEMDGDSLIAIVMPAAWTAADITFQVSYDNGTTFQVLIDQDGNEVTATSPTASKTTTLKPANFPRIDQIKIQSGTSGTPVTQAAERVLGLVRAAV